MQIELRTQCTENRMFITRLKRVLLAENHHCGWNGPTGSRCTITPEKKARSKLRGGVSQQPTSHLTLKTATLCIISEV